MELTLPKRVLKKECDGRPLIKKGSAGAFFCAISPERLLFSQVCAFPAQTVRKRTGRKHPAHREAIGMAGRRYCSAEG